MWSPPSPESNREEVVEEPCIALGMIFFKKEDRADTVYKVNGLYRFF